METKEMPLWERLSTLRKEQELSQSDVAEALNVSRQTVTRWETGEVAPTAENRKRLSQLYGVPMEVLTEGGADWAPPPGPEPPAGREPSSGPAAPDGPSPAEEAVRKERRRGTRWKRAALAALLALAVALAALVYVVRKDQPGENRGKLSEVQVESVESVPTITFEVEDW